MLAAGAGRRIGTPKALLRRGDRLLVEQAVDTLCEAGCAPVVVVLGAGAGQVQATADLSRADVLVNRAWATGMGSSLRAGLAALSATDVDAVVLTLVDMPGVSAAAVRRVAALPYRQALVCASYGGRRDHPVLLGREHWPGVTALANADVGVRPYLVARGSRVQAVNCDGVADDIDIDTAAEALGWGITVAEAAVERSAG